MVGAVDDPLAIGREGWAAVVAEFVRELLYVAAVGVHGVDVEIAVANGGERDLLAVERDCGFGIIAGSVGELLEVGAVRIRRENVVSRINSPDITLGEVRAGRAFGAGEVGRSVENLLAVRIEEAAGSASFAGGDHVLVAAVDVHDEDLIALHVAMRGLEDELFAVGGEIGLCVGSSE